MKQTKKNLYPNLDNLIIGLSHQDYALLAICCYFWDIKEWVYYKREGKYSLLMHAFLPCLLFFLSTSLFIFFSVISFCFLP